MLITAPFAGPVSFPLLVAKVLSKVNFELKNSCETNEIGDVVLDSITNVARLRLKGYRIVAGVFVKMYSLIGNKNSEVIYTIRQGTLADYNARLYAKLTNKKEVVNTTPEDALKRAEEGKLALVGIEVKLGELFEDEMMKLNHFVPQCVIYSKTYPTEVIEAYEEGIRLMRERPEESALIISSASKYYSLQVMKNIIHVYNHRLTTKGDDLSKSIELYSLVKPEVKDLEIY
ncbi:DUF3834 domain-containing protein [Sulfurisphaera ohwakuensis]|uniref:DUF3834 domain-containing protein n=1 Tax=Sulfurisphaera ohwakuensis TaxID=69656 RepID=A0A650CF78_SULOH|nr:DUF3834 domain-containing protein [Sulfurisphaera ohwakuensis]MBB5254394.1 hypothetical protein [Sulfurisphaera ohwakuensis]QGR16325.1 DUF3834 domain-containing protein [Sulfurisphaera ohwakuensis]